MDIVEKEAFNITGTTIKANWKELWEKMPAAWEHMFKKYAEIQNRKDDILMDVSLNKSGDTYTQFIGVEVFQNGQAVPEGMQTIQIPAKKYLHYKHKGSLKEIAHSFGKMYEWAEEQNLKTEDFKLDIGYTPSGKEETHDLYIEIVD